VPASRTLSAGTGRARTQVSEDPVRPHRPDLSAHRGVAAHGGAARPCEEGRAVALPDAREVRASIARPTPSEESSVTAEFDTRSSAKRSGLMPDLAPRDRVPAGCPRPPRAWPLTRPDRGGYSGPPPRAFALVGWVQKSRPVPISAPPPGQTGPRPIAYRIRDGSALAHPSRVRAGPPVSRPRWCGSRAAVRWPDTTCVAADRARTAGPARRDERVR
jgi:hypothetical protein